MSYRDYLSREEISQIYNFTIEKRKEGFGQRKISRMISEKFNQNISEGAISNWIFYNKKPFGNERTQFKAKQKPKKEEIQRLYINNKESAQRIAKKYNVATITFINWLKSYKIDLRTHVQSMNTENIKKELREKKLRRPTKEFSKLSPEKAYILGVLCGDGCISERYIRFEIRKDEEFIREFVKCIKEVYGLDYKYYYYAKRDSFVNYISNQIICSDLLRYGKFKTFEWNIPEEIIDCKEEENSSMFLRGLFDSEGSSSKYCVSMSSANENGIKQASELLKKLKIENKIMKTKEGYYILYITKRERLKRFREKIGFTIKRKMELINNLK
jgi:intein-encoded DNA endonuclease-like protein